MIFDQLSLVRVIRFWRAFLFGLVIFGLLMPVPSASAHDDAEGRVIKQEMTVPLGHWQLASWQNGATVCDLFVYHTDRPTPNDVYQSCGRKIQTEWLTTPPCGGGGGAYCSGLMLRFISLGTKEITKDVPLPDINLWVETVNCVPGQLCNDRPELRVVAEEPVGGAYITKVHVRYEQTEKTYDGTNGQFKLPLTADKGGWLLYWADSSLGDESKLFEVKFRSVLLKGGDTPSYRLDLLTDDWLESLPAGSAMWEIFPSTNQQLPMIYEQPVAMEYLATANPYSYLAAHLIRKGIVDGRSCKDGGVLPDGSATPCGEKIAASQVVAWQNKYDAQIYQAALKYTIPARLLKGMIAQESQFWPVSENPYEQGLGYVTEDGVSMLLLWNQPYYRAICPLAFDQTTCWGGYSNLRAEKQTILRGIIFGKIGTPDEVDLLAAMLYASATQTKQLVTNVMGRDLSDVTTYEDMWKMSVANYYAGSGCLGDTLLSGAGDDLPLTWDKLSIHLSGICTVADTYVKRVLNYSGTQAISYPPMYLGLKPTILQQIPRQSISASKKY